VIVPFFKTKLKINLSPKSTKNQIEFSVFTRQELDRPFKDKKQVEIVAKKWMNQ